MVNIFGYEIAIFDLIQFCGLFFVSFVYVVRTGNIKKFIKEVFDMNYKFKTPQTVDNSVGQTFDKTKPVYRLNKATGQLESTGETIDIQELINSCLETCLAKALDRLMPEVKINEDVAQLELMREDLDIAMDTCARAEDYRTRFGLADSLSVEDIYNEVAKQADIVKARIETAQSLKSNKEVSIDEKKVFSENETASVSSQKQG